MDMAGIGRDSSRLVIRQAEYRIKKQVAIPGL